jgi:hypothetical protein
MEPITYQIGVNILGLPIYITHYFFFIKEEKVRSSRVIPVKRKRHE